MEAQQRCRKYICGTFSYFELQIPILIIQNVSFFFGWLVATSLFTQTLLKHRTISNIHNFTNGTQAMRELCTPRMRVCIARWMLYVTRLNALFIGCFLLYIVAFIISVCGHVLCASNLFICMVRAVFFYRIEIILGSVSTSSRNFVWQLLMYTVPVLCTVYCTPPQTDVWENIMLLLFIVCRVMLWRSLKLTEWRGSYITDHFSNKRGSSVSDPNVRAYRRCISSNFIFIFIFILVGRGLLCAHSICTTTKINFYE